MFCVVQVNGSVCYNGKNFDQFVVERTAAYVDQVTSGKGLEQLSTLAIEVNVWFQPATTIAYRLNCWLASLKLPAYIPILRPSCTLAFAQKIVGFVPTCLHCYSNNCKLYRHV